MRRFHVEHGVTLSIFISSASSHITWCVPPTVSDMPGKLDV